MRHSFHAPEDAPSLDRSLLTWKYYEAGPSWNGSRSYVLSDRGAFVAHAAIWPLQIRLQSGVRTGIGFCDWAASEEQRGVGLLLLKKLTTLAPFVLVIGGADITRQILPRVGFKPWAELPVYARVLRPVRQMLSRTSLNWKEPARLARNAAWSFAGLAPSGGWTAEFAISDADTISRSHEQTGSINSREFVAFLLKCPTITFRSVLLRKEGVAQGYAVVSTVGGQARLADLRIELRAQADWDSALAVVVCLLRRETDASELIAIASVPHLQTSLETNGFRMREQRPLVVLDPEGKMYEEPVPQLGMLVDDASFLHIPEFPFLT